MIKIKCPKCGTESSMSLTQFTFEGPYRCWKCKETFTLKIEGKEIKSLEPLNPAEFERIKQQIEEGRGKG